MSSAVSFQHRAGGITFKKSAGCSQKSPGRPTVLIAVSDPEVRETLTNMVQFHRLNIIWLESVADVKSATVNMRIDTCLCGFWFQDGTFREIAQHLRRERIDIPIVIVSGPASPIEWEGCLSVMNIGALDCICYPFQQSHFDAILESTIASHLHTTTVLAGQNERDLGGAA